MTSEESKGTEFSEALKRVVNRLFDLTASISVPVAIKNITQDGVVWVGRPAEVELKQDKECTGAATMLCLKYVKEFRAFDSKASQNDVWRWWLGDGKYILNGIAAMVLDKWQTALRITTKDGVETVADICVCQCNVQKAFVGNATKVSLDDGKTTEHRAVNKHSVILIETDKNKCYVLDLTSTSLGVPHRDVAGVACPIVFRSKADAQEYLHLKGVPKGCSGVDWFRGVMQSKELAARLAVEIGRRMILSFAADVGFTPSS